MKPLKNILPYMVKPEKLELLMVTPNFSVNLDTDLINVMLPVNKYLEEYDKKEVQDADIFKPIINNINKFLGWISAHLNVIQKYFILETINYKLNENDKIIINFIWDKKTKEIPKIAYNFITERDESRVILHPLVEDDKTLQISYNMR